MENPYFRKPLNDKTGHPTPIAPKTPPAWDRRALQHVDRSAGFGPAQWIFVSEWTPRFSDYWGCHMPNMISGCLGVILDKTYPLDSISVFSTRLVKWSYDESDTDSALCCLLEHRPWATNQLSQVVFQDAIEAPFGRFAMLFPLPCLTALVGCTLFCVVIYWVYMYMYLYM